MLERVSLRNFQTHERLDIDLDPHVTTLVGESDVGKSSVLRAIRWCALNRPAGDQFVRHGSQRAKVVLVADGRKVERRKGKGVNCYRLDGRTLNAPGQSVPDPVVNVLNVGEENFQRQHDPQFLFGLSAGQVGRELNRVVNLDLMDLVLGNVGQMVRKAKASVEASKERLADARKRAVEMAWVRDMDADLRKVELVEAKLGETKVKVDGLRETLRTLRDGRRNAQEAQERAVDAETLFRSAEALWTVQAKAAALREALERLSEAGERAERLSETADAKEAEVAKIIKDGCPVCGRM